MAEAATWLARLGHIESRWCRRANRACERQAVHVIFATASRLGDGVFWYALMATLPVIDGTRGASVWTRMLMAAAAGTIIYRFLKTRLVRERPFDADREIRAGARALDRYSFPSGHTLHAVCFTLVGVQAFPELAAALVPFALLVAASRVVLGLHYPSDVVAGAVFGAGLAALTVTAGA